jgi:hypothetical protein
MTKSHPPSARNAPITPSPRERALICEVIRLELALEDLSRTNSRRNVRLRMAIGLPAFPRTIHGERCQ